MRITIGRCGLVLACGAAVIGAGGARNGDGIGAGTAGLPGHVPPVAPSMARDSLGVGPCPVVGRDSTPLGDIIKNPDVKPRRLDLTEDLTVGQGAYRLATDEDLDHNIIGQMRRVGVVAIIDTSGRAIPGSIAITSSTSGRLSLAICNAMATMKFRPGKKGGVTVFAMYSEKMQFIGSSASSTDQGAQSQSSKR